LGKAFNRKAAILQIVVDEGRYPESLLVYAIYANRLRNPEREQFRHEHAEELAIFEDIPIETLELAGVSGR